MEHEAVNHFSDSFYECHDCEKNFQEEAHFRTHLTKSHYILDLNHAQYLVIISASKSSKVRAFTGQFCPLCKQTGWPTQCAYFTHLGKHLEQIALSALPPDPDSDSESEASQANTAADQENSRNTDEEEKVTFKCIQQKRSKKQDSVNSALYNGALSDLLNVEQMILKGTIKMRPNAHRKCDMCRVRRTKVSRFDGSTRLSPRAPMYACRACPA